MGPVLGAIVLPTLIALAAAPVVLVVGYRLVGIRVAAAKAH